MTTKNLTPKQRALLLRARVRARALAAEANEDQKRHALLRELLRPLTSNPKYREEW